MTARLGRTMVALELRVRDDNEALGGAGQGTEKERKKAGQGEGLGRFGVVLACRVRCDERMRTTPNPPTYELGLGAVGQPGQMNCVRVHRCRGFSSSERYPDCPLDHMKEFRGLVGDALTPISMSTN